MTKQVINVGSAANDGTGDKIRAAFQKANGNFDELYGSIPAINVKAPPYNARGDAKTVGDFASTNGSAVVTSATAAFTAADVGKTLCVVGGAANYAPLTSTIASVQSATQVTLSANAGNTVSGAKGWFGTDDSAAFQAAIDAAYAASDASGYYGFGRGVIVPPGNYFVTNVKLRRRCGIRGFGPGQTVLMNKPGSNAPILSPYAATDDRQYVGNMTIVANRDSTWDQSDLYCLKWNQSFTAGSFESKEPLSTFENLQLTDAMTGFMVNGLGGSLFHNISVTRCSIGCTVDSRSNSFSDCQISECSKVNWAIGTSASGNRFVNCVGSVAGLEGYGATEFVNWLIQGQRNEFVGCIGRESNGSNWYLDSNASKNRFVGCSALDAGCIGTQHGTIYGQVATVKAGWELHSGGGNLFVGCHVGLDAHGTSSYATHGIYLDATDNNRGEFWTDVGMAFSVAKTYRSSVAANVLRIDNAALA